jgi:hypothetical protein
MKLKSKVKSIEILIFSFIQFRSLSGKCTTTFGL